MTKLPMAGPIYAYFLGKREVSQKAALLLYMCSLLTLLLAACQGTPTSSTNTTLSSTPSTSARSQTLPAITATGHFQEYPLPQTSSGLMRPAIDHEGRVWFGEMGHNYLATFDPRTHAFQQRIPPHGLNGIMGIVVASDDTIWFAEQYANYIGHYFPNTNTYQTYRLPTLTIPDPTNTSQTLSLTSAPNDLALDTQGNLWFTELNADSIGKLDPRTGHMQIYPLTSKKSVQKFDPYGITIDPQDMVWFTQSTNDRLGRLDPHTGHITFFTPTTPSTQLMEIASDTHGTLWATSFNNGLLLSFNPQTATFTSYYAPASGNSLGGIYGLSIGRNGEIWLTMPAQNTIARFDVTHHRFAYYPIPTKASLPLGLVMGNNQTVWFTEAGSDKIGVLNP